MATLKCKSCGNPLTVREGQQIVQCDHCDVVQTIPKLDDESKLKMFERATELRLRCEFDQATNVFQSITLQFPDEAEAYWGLCLCKYGIEYVDDPSTLAKIPTCHRTYHQSILTDTNYLAACQYADTSSKYRYEEEAQEIDRLQKKILEISRTEQPFDIFICYKETDDLTGIRTNDSIAAQDIYTELVKDGYSVFYSRVTLRSKAGSEYEPIIYAALSSAKVMLVLGNQKEYFEAVWVKNEWSRFLDMTQSEKKTIVVCYENIKPEIDLPVQLRNIQALDMGNKIFFNDLLNSIERVIPRKPQFHTQGVKSEEDLSATPYRKELNFDDGVYVGAALGNRPHGFGTRFFTNGNKYEGNWNMGNMHGQGTFFYSNGDSWSGEWNNGRAWNGSGIYKTSGETPVVNVILNHCGKMKINVIQSIRELTGATLAKAKSIAENTPKIIQKNISMEDAVNVKKTFESIGAKVSIEKINGVFETYEGTLKQGALIGTGKKYTNGKLTHEGIFENGKLNGKGTAYLPNDMSCSGDFKDGWPWNATGTYALKGKSSWRFTGDWIEGEPNGEGVIESTEGTVTGNFQKGLNGIVTWKFKDGRTYEGTIKNAVICGNGKLFASNGKLRYEGEFTDSQVSGEGIWYSDYGWRYEGNMLKGKLHGQGTMYYPQGTWTGEWKDDRRWKGNGLIIFYDDKGQPTGKFFNGYMVNGKAAGHGILRFEDGSRFDGDFLEDNYYNGVVYNANNQVIDTYVNGVSQRQKANDRNAAIAGTALGILRGFTGI